MNNAQNRIHMVASTIDCVLVKRYCCCETINKYINGTPKLKDNHTMGPRILIGDSLAYTMFDHNEANPIPNRRTIVLTSYTNAIASTALVLLAIVIAVSRSVNPSRIAAKLTPIRLRSMLQMHPARSRLNAIGMQSNTYNSALMLNT